MWRWLSATALVAVGLVMGASVAGAQQTAAQTTSWAESGHGLASSRRRSSTPTPVIS